MRIVAHRKSLVHALAIVEKATAKRDVKPILKDVKIVAEEGGSWNSLMLMATDLEYGVRRPMPVCQVVEAGAVCVVAKDLIQVLKNLSDDEVTLQTDVHGIKILGAATENHLPTELADDFPDIPDFTAQEYHIVPVGKLRRMIELTSFAAAKESTKFAMTGVRLELNGKLIAVATDAKRMAFMEGNCTKVGDPKDSEILVPTKALDLLCAATKDGDWRGADVMVAVNWKTWTDTPINPKYPPEERTEPVEAIFEVNGTVIYTRLVEGRYPPYREIFPKNRTASIELPVGPLLANVKQAATACDDETRRLKFIFDQNMLTLVGKSCTKGESKIVMPAVYGGDWRDCGDGPWEKLEDAQEHGKRLGIPHAVVNRDDEWHVQVPLNFNLDPKYVQDVLKCFGKKDVLTLDIVDGNRPVLFRSGVDYKYLVMPLA